MHSGMKWLTKDRKDSARSCKDKRPIRGASPDIHLPLRLLGFGSLLLVLLLLTTGCPQTTGGGDLQGTIEADPVEPTRSVDDVDDAATRDPRNANALDAEGFGEGAVGEVTEDDLHDAAEIDPMSIEELNARQVLRTIYFAFNSTTLSNEALATLNENARWLRQHPSYRIIIEGHCDERGSLEYNLELGAQRARSVRDHMAQLGIDENRIETISFGEEQPADSRSNEAAWARNRRAEFRLISR